MDAPGKKSTSGVSHIRLSGVQGIAEKAEPEYHYSTLPADRLRGWIDDCRVESRAGHPGDQPLRRGMAAAPRARRLLPPGCPFHDDRPHLHPYLDAGAGAGASLPDQSLRPVV